MKIEPLFYEEQSKALSTFLSILGLALSLIFSMGAIIGAAITMYAAVSNRIGEIGTLRALGFRRASILSAFLLESMLLALLGGAAGWPARPSCNSSRCRRSISRRSRSCRSAFT